MDDTLRILYSRSSYQESLQRAKIARLEDRRNELCMRTFDDITKGGPSLKQLTPIMCIAHDYNLGRFLFFRTAILMENSTSSIS